MDSYRSLAAWHAGHTLCIETLRALDAAYQPRAVAVFEQLRRAVVSVETNVVEGYALASGPQFRRHVRIALGAAAEAQALLNIAEELAYLPAETLNRLRHHADHAMRALYGLSKSLERSRTAASEHHTLAGNT